MATDTRIPRVSFEISKAVQKRIRSLPKSVNISEEMRGCLDKVLAKYEQPFLRKALTENNEVK